MLLHDFDRQEHFPVFVEAMDPHEIDEPKAHLLGTRLENLALADHMELDQDVGKILLARLCLDSLGFLNLLMPQSVRTGGGRKLRWRFGNRAKKSKRR